MRDFDGMPTFFGSTSGFPEYGYDEPDDSDTVYYDTWEEAEEAAARHSAWAKKYLAEMEAKKELVEKGS